jgi:hypothetical protein
MCVTGPCLGCMRRQEEEAKRMRIRGWVVNGVVYTLTAAHIALYIAMLFHADWEVSRSGCLKS